MHETFFRISFIEFNLLCTAAATTTTKKDVDSSEVIVVGLPYFSKQKSGQSIDQCFSTIDSQYKMIIKSGRMATLNSGNLFWGQTFTMIIIIMELTR
ncbi:hypothetical protein DERF_002647 [Dermatophagoides farinae]|uniref:Uncharacterized protein n=1 Tax=Dermatophagoides farinae TaxID=6954 RepID=A0A922LAP9_DERFA|nr:hypothetical protein DERF_002647 [Dermatophagoides farinae]